jgi:hypothetical protein
MKDQRMADIDPVGLIINILCRLDLQISNLSLTGVFQPYARASLIAVATCHKDGLTIPAGFVFHFKLDGGRGWRYIRGCGVHKPVSVMCE